MYIVCRKMLNLVRKLHSTVSKIRQDDLNVCTIAAHALKERKAYDE
jgi:hypothetical protein